MDTELLESLSAKLKQFMDLKVNIKELGPSDVKHSLDYDLAKGIFIVMLVTAEKREILSNESLIHVAYKMYKAIDVLAKEEEKELIKEVARKHEEEDTPLNKKEYELLKIIPLTYLLFGLETITRKIKELNEVECNDSDIINAAIDKVKTKGLQVKLNILNDFTHAILVEFLNSMLNMTKNSGNPHKAEIGRSGLAALKIQSKLLINSDELYKKNDLNISDVGLPLIEMLPFVINNVTYLQKTYDILFRDDKSDYTKEDPLSLGAMSILVYSCMGFIDDIINQEKDLLYKYQLKEEMSNEQI